VWYGENLLDTEQDECLRSLPFALMTNDTNTQRDSSALSAALFEDESSHRDKCESTTPTTSAVNELGFLSGVESGPSIYIDQNFLSNTSGSVFALQPRRSTPLGVSIHANSFNQDGTSTQHDTDDTVTNNSMCFTQLLRQADNGNSQSIECLLSKPPNGSSSINHAYRQPNLAGRGSFGLKAESTPMNFIRPFVVSSRLISKDSFEVTATIINTNIDDVLTVLSNPHLLCMWCDPISAVVVTEEKGGFYRNPELHEGNHGVRIVSPPNEDSSQKTAAYDRKRVS